MGAHNFHTSEYGKDAAEAFADAQSEALFEYGHNPYNGTISTVHDFVEIPLEEGETVDQWASRVLDDPRVQKWEACAAVKDPDFKEENGRWYWHFAGWAAC